MSFPGLPMLRSVSTWCLLILAAVSLTGASVNAAEASDLDEVWASTVTERIRSEGDLPALGVALVRVGKKPLVAVAGLRKKTATEKAKEEDLWHLGSDTKAMTAVLVGMMVEEGKLSWESDLAEIFPEQSPEFRSAVGKITVLQLLQHRSGLKPNADWRSFDVGKPLTEQRKDVLARLPGLRAKNEAGRAFEYSNLGYVVLGAILEKRSGKSWEMLMREKLFGPLGMTNAGFGGTGTPGQIDQPWPHSASGKPMPKNGPAVDNPLVMAPAGGVHASLARWSLFIEEYLLGLRGEGKLLKRDTYQVLATPGSGQEMACGWAVLKRGWGGTVLTHAGSNTMNYAVAWLAPEKGFAVLAVSNQAGPKASSACDALCSEVIMKQVKR